MYFCLIPYFLARSARRAFGQDGNWWKLLLCALVDSTASFFIVQAYTMTSLTSIFVLNTFAVPSAFVITKLFFRVTYKKNHFAALILCLLGIGMAIIQDIVVAPIDKQDPFTSDAFMGDLCVLISAVLYALSNVLSEYLFKTGTPISAYLAGVGLFGCLITLIEAFAFGEEAQLSGKPVGPVFLLYLGFCGVNFFNYTVIPFYIKRSGAALLNISNRTTILWSMLVDIVLFKKQFHWLYLTAFCLVLSGVWIFSVEEPVYHVDRDSLLNGPEDVEGEVGDEEN
jgi:solute carrier family 35 protein F1/2